MNVKHTLQEKEILLSINGLSYQAQNPSKRNISVIRQFARSYHVENRLPHSLSGIILN
jgi:hypothetical protein